MSSARFHCPSSSLSLKGLLKRTRRALWIGGVLALGVHLMFAQLGGFGEEQKVAKPLTTQFIKREPRLTKPLELKRRPQPKRRGIERKMISVKAKMQRRQAEVRLQPSQVLRGLAKPRVQIRRRADFESVASVPRSLAETILASRQAQQKIDTSLELLDIEALDTGKYHALVVVDPTDKRGVKGFLHLAGAYPLAASLVENNSLGAVLGALAAAMNRFTDIATDIRGTYSFDSQELSKNPWLYTRQCERPFKLTDSEAMNLGQYLLLGGFLFADGFPQGSGAYAPEIGLCGMMKDALRAQGVEFGKDWSFQKLPNVHAIYHCYFDFEGPPVSQDYLAPWLVIPYLEGIELGGRLAVLVSLKWYAHAWTSWSPRPGPYYKHWDNTRQLQFGVNSIVFALTQEGSITHRLMESIN